MSVNTFNPEQPTGKDGVRTTAGSKAQAAVQGRTVFYAMVLEDSSGYLVTVATRMGDAKQFHLSTKADVSATVDLYMAQWEALPNDNKT